MTIREEIVFKISHEQLEHFLLYRVCCNGEFFFAKFSLRIACLFVKEESEFGEEQEDFSSKNV